MKKLLLLLVVLIFSFGFFSDVQAGASLYLSPSAGSYTVGNTFLVQAKVNSGGVPINAADGTLIFDVDDLEIKSISKEGSIFSLWVQEPTFSNSLGTINLAGGKPSPGFTGAAGTIINITFRARTAGTANLTFASGSVLADDGKGTNILTSMGAGVYTLSGRTITPTEPPEEGLPLAPTIGVPVPPVVSSPTHPDEKKWYSNNNPEFNWQFPTDVTEVSYAIDQNPSTNPKFIAESLVEKVNFPDLEDGIWYFHINFKNQYGWGGITHRKVLIDTEPPGSFTVSVDNENDPTNPTPVFLFKTTDSLSGVEYYEVILNGKSYASTLPQNIKDNPYEPLPLAPGKYSLEVKAFDKAANFALVSTNFEILPSGFIKITKIPKNLRIGDILRVEGETLAETNVRVYIQREGEEPILEKTFSDLAGNFVLQYDKALAQGDYLAWAQAEDERGALSEPTQKYPLKIGLPPFLQFGKIAIDYLTIVITLIVLIIGALVIIFYGWYRISLWRKRVRTETREVSQSVLSSFRALRDEVEEQIEYLDGKPGLNKDERKVRDKLKEALNISEEFIGKELKDIEKELE